MQRTPSPDYYSVGELAALISGPHSHFHTFVVNEYYHLCRYSTASTSFGIRGITSHSIAVQHKSSAKVRYDIGGDRFIGEWLNGTYNIVPAACPIKISYEEPIDFTALWLSPNLCRKLLDAPNFEVSPFFSKENPLIKQTLFLLSESAVVGQAFTRLYQDSLVAGMVAILGGHSEASKIQPRKGGLSSPRLRQVLDLIEEQLHNEVTLSSLAAELAISEWHFCILFKRSTGLSPHRYLVRRRIEKAMDLLRHDKSMAITNVAFSVGFASSAHFSTMFRKVTGLSPTAFRSNPPDKSRLPSVRLGG